MRAGIALGVALAAAVGFVGLAGLRPGSRAGAGPEGPASADRKLDQVLERLGRIEQRLDEIEEQLTASRPPVGDVWVPRSRLRSFSDKPTREMVVEWNGGWWSASQVEVKGERTLIHYKGWDASWNEWVGKDRVRYVAVPAAAKPGQEVLVRWSGVWLAAVVEDVKGDRVQLAPKQAAGPQPTRQ
jgi:hypothetical protein